MYLGMCPLDQEMNYECVRAVLVNLEGYLGPGFRKKDVTGKYCKVSESFFILLPGCF